MAEPVTDYVLDHFGKLATRLILIAAFSSFVMLVRLWFPGVPLLVGFGGPVALIVAFIVWGIVAGVAQWRDVLVIIHTNYQRPAINVLSPDGRSTRG